MSDRVRTAVAAGASVAATSAYVTLLVSQGGPTVNPVAIAAIAATLVAVVSVLVSGAVRRWTLGVAAVTLGICGLLGLMSVGILWLAAAGACAWAITDETDEVAASA